MVRHLSILSLSSTVGLVCARNDWAVVPDVKSLGEDIPADWAIKYARSDLLYTADEATVEYRPEIGNGFVGTVVGDSIMQIAGVFNGCAGCSQDPSRRAHLPSPLPLMVDGHSTAEAALDLREAAYTRRYDDGAQLRFYAHRARRSLLVAELSASADTTVSLSGAGGTNPSSSDADVKADIRNVSGQPMMLWTGQTKEAETVRNSVIKFAVAFSYVVDGQVSLQQGGVVRYVAAVRTSLESDDPEQAAIADWEAAMSLSAVDLYNEHVAEWASLWESGIEVEGRPDVAQQTNSSLYYLLSSVRENAPYSTSPGGLAGNGHYNGHTFWDVETWMYPSMLILHPEIADTSMLQYRIDRINESMRKAQSNGYDGAMFAWESAATGAETIPPGYPFGDFEQHITGDIAFAAQQFWYATRNETWLAAAFPGLIEKTADFWVSRVEWSDGVAHINQVIPPDEYLDKSPYTNDSVFTNHVAKNNLIFASEAAAVLGKLANPKWASTAEAIPILLDEEQGIHPEYSGYSGDTVKQADVILLSYPMMMDMPQSIRKADLDYYLPRTDPAAPCMSIAMYVIGYLEVGDTAQADAHFNNSFANTQAPFNVWTETPAGGSVNFLTGMGGFLQLVLFGLPGLRVNKDHLSFSPSLVQSMESVTVRGIRYLGSVFTLSYDSSIVTLMMTSGAGLSVIDSAGKSIDLVSGEHVTFPRGQSFQVKGVEEQLIVV